MSSFLTAILLVIEMSHEFATKSIQRKQLAVISILLQMSKHNNNNNHAYIICKTILAKL